MPIIDFPLSNPTKLAEATSLVSEDLIAWSDGGLQQLESQQVPVSYNGVGLCV